MAYPMDAAVKPIAAQAQCYPQAHIPLGALGMGNQKHRFRKLFVQEFHDLDSY
jgi:hypothetical protein